eukprot:TRINITY_DN43124_c0_g1_i1.p2 TRINITY_DN43124_c0_g1~~TRINITY_DN43124_c0_g1_i1.p2  ORF type:complete len:447 (+),score=203.79 TRINITY_DN43124_c0_g1_i1:47-1342(+)
MVFGLACLAAVAVSVGRTPDEEIVALRAEVAMLKQRLGVKGVRDGETCSSQGYYYEDVDACKCFKCFSGEHCQNLDENCLIDDGPGNPFLFEEYWRNTTAEQHVPLYYRSPYQMATVVLKGAASEQGDLMPELSKTIFNLHEKIGNIANLGGKSLVIGSGGTELIGAATWACKQLHGPQKHMHLVASPPYYNGYYENYVGIGATNFTFSTSTELDASSVVEMVTYPNNPTNEFRKSVYGGRAACTIHDQVYWWPSLVNLTEGDAPLNTAISLFSMSKLTGHAGTRFGWALVDDEALATKMGEYISSMQIAVSIDAQYRTYSVLKYLQEEDNMRFFEWARVTLEARWAIINDLFDTKKQSRFVQHSRPGGFYGWVECLVPSESKNCLAVFNGAKIAPKSGTIFGSGAQYVRLELVQPTAVFNIMVQRIKALL